MNTLEGNSTGKPWNFVSKSTISHKYCTPNAYFIVMVSTKITSKCNLAFLLLLLVSVYGTSEWKRLLFELLMLGSITHWKRFSIKTEWTMSAKGYRMIWIQLTFTSSLVTNGYCHHIDWLNIIETHQLWWLLETKSRFMMRKGFIILWQSYTRLAIHLS